MKKPPRLLLAPDEGGFFFVFLWKETVSMSVTIPSSLSSPSAATRPRAVAGPSTIPLSIYAVTLASLLTIVGILWDISWHRSIGRDKFLSPPHILVYLGAIFAGLFSGIQVVYNSFFRKEAARAADVRVWGIFYSPLGSMFCIWGAIAMLTSAPFDDWWHSAYGLDVTILSPPHTLLAMGMIFLQFGACVSICKYLNLDAADPAGGTRRPVLQTLFVISALSLLTMVYTLFTDYLHIRAMRSGPFYVIATIASLLLLPAFGRALRMKWGMTAVTGGYFLLVAISNWTLQLFPAEPKLGPILTHITHFQPANFPALVIIPAMAMDLILQRSRGGDWRRAFWLSLAFVLLLAAAQYPLSGFLQESPYARNWFFTSNTYYFGLSPNWPWRYKFRPDDIAPLPVLLEGLGIAVMAGWLCARLSLRWGRWMQNIQR
jgi:hypothetical protein